MVLRDTFSVTAELAFIPFFIWSKVSAVDFLAGLTIIRLSNIDYTSLSLNDIIVVELITDWRIEGWRKLFSDTDTTELFI